MKYTTVDSPVGPLVLVRSTIGLAGLYLAPPVAPDASLHLPPLLRGGRPPEGWSPDPTGFVEVTDQLAAYWTGERQVFELPLDLQGSAFQRSVWAALQEIAYGTTTSYGALAQRLGVPGASRAVGLANGRNPVSIVVPCHRVVGSTGLLTGYSGGVANKRFLLAHEAAHSPDAALTLF